MQEIHDLEVGKMVLVQTQRSNQIAILRRLSDDANLVPRVEV